MAAAIESVHTCRVSVVFTTAGQGHNGSMHIVVRATIPVIDPSDQRAEISVDADWPSGKARSEVGLVYNLMWQLDYAISEAYKQLPLNGG